MKIKVYLYGILKREFKINPDKVNLVEINIKQAETKELARLTKVDYILREEK